MTINIKTTNTSLSTQMADYIEDRVNRLLKFVSCAKDSATAFLELERFKKRKSGDVYRAEIRLKLPIQGVRVEGHGENWLMAFNVARQKAQRELKKYKETKCQPDFSVPRLPF